MTDLKNALNTAVVALRIEAVNRRGMEGHHLTGLADAIDAQLRIEQQRKPARRSRRPLPPAAAV